MIKMKSRYKSKKGRGRQSRSRTSKRSSISSVRPNRKHYLILPIFFIIIVALYYIVPDCITITVGIDEYKKEEIKEIVKEVLQEEESTPDILESTKEQSEEEQTNEEQTNEDIEHPKVEETAKVTSRGGLNTREYTIKLTGYRITSYHPGDNYASGTKTGSGKTINDFKTTNIGGKSVYTYNNKLVVAAATQELKSTGYNVNGSQTNQPDKHYFSYYDELQIQIDGVWYDAIVLDSCGASMWSGYYRIDLYVPSSSDVIDRSDVTIKI